MTALLQIRAAVSLAGTLLLTLPAEAFFGAGTLEALFAALATITAGLLAAVALAAWIHSRAR